jgi:hypothetical protein
VCAQVGNQQSRGVVTARVQTNVVRSLHHQRRDLYQSTYPVPLERSGLILLSHIPQFYAKILLFATIRIEVSYNQFVSSVSHVLSSTLNKWNSILHSSFLMKLFEDVI